MNLACASRPGKVYWIQNSPYGEIRSQSEERAMRLHRVWDEVFSTWSHLAVLRALQHSARGMTGREVARVAGMNHRAGLEALSKLEALGIVSRIRGGRDHLFSLNREHALVAGGILPLLAAESRYAEDLKKIVGRRLGKHAVSVIVFGSVARGEETPASDLDVCLVVSRASDKSSALEAAHDLAPQLLREYGVRLSPFVLSKTEFRRRARNHVAPVDSLVREGMVVSGLSLGELVHGKK